MTIILRILAIWPTSASTSKCSHDGHVTLQPMFSWVYAPFDILLPLINSTHDVTRSFPCQKPS